MIGRFLYSQATRPNIVYSVNVLSQFVVDPRQHRLDALMQVLRYLKAAPGQGILLPRSGGNDLLAYSALDWLGCCMTRHSRTCYLLFFGRSPDLMEN